MKQPGTETDGESPRQLLISLADITNELEQQFGGCTVDIKRYETKIIIPEGKVFSGSTFDLDRNAQALLETICAYIAKHDYTQVVIGSHFLGTKGQESTDASNRFD